MAFRQVGAHKMVFTKSMFWKPNLFLNISNSLNLLPGGTMLKQGSFVEQFNQES